jgi:hypothetical protein
MMTAALLFREILILLFGNSDDLIASFQLLAVDAELVSRGCPGVVRRDLNFRLDTTARSLAGELS